MTETQPSIVVEYKNERPIELLDLTASLAAFGEEFNRFLTDQADVRAQPRLYVHQMRPGSIIAELIPWLEQVDFIIKNREIIAGFMTNWQDILSAILNLDSRAKAIEKPTLRAARTFVEPVAKDGGSQLNVIANDGGQVFLNINLSSEKAGTIQRNATHLLTHDVPSETPFNREPMVLFQMRDAPPGKSGDMGYIDRFSPKPLKLTFATEEAKQGILERSDNPFDLIFFVSGVMKTAGGNPAAYHILSLDDIAPKPS